MAERSIGKVYAEIDLDTSRYTKSQQQLLRDATSSSLKIEENFKKLGIRSSAEFDLLRAKISNSYNAIVNDARATANDIVRAEQAKNAQLARLQEEQFGRETSLIGKLRAHWLAASAAIYAAQRVIREAWSMALEAADLQERINVLDAFGRQAGMTGEQIATGMAEAARGLISLRDAADMSAAARNLGLTGQQMIAFTRVAEQLSDVIGGSVKEGFDRMTIAAASGRTQTLAQMGIIIDLDKAYERYAASIGMSVKQLSEEEKQQVRNNTVLAEAQRKVAALGEPTDSTRDKIDRLSASISNLRTTLGKVIADGFAPFADALASIVSLFDKAITRAHQYSAIAEMMKRSGVVNPQSVVNIVEQSTGFSDVGAARGLRAASIHGFTPTPPRPVSDEDKKRREEASRNLYESLKAQQAILEEADALGAKFLLDQQKREEDAAKVLADIQQKSSEGFIAAWVARIDAQKELDTKAAQDQVKLLQDLAADRAKIQEQISQEDIQAWVKRIEAEQELDYQAALAEVERLDGLVKQRSAATEQLRQQFREVFSSIADGITTAIRGVQLGTQTMEQAFKNMALNILLSIQDLIIRRGLMQLENVLGDLIFGASTAKGSAGSTGGPGLIGMLGGFIASGIGSIFGFAEGGIVPGPIGRPRLSVVHGGEEIRTPEQQKASGVGTQITQVFAPQIGLAEATRREVWAMMPTIKEQTIAAVLELRTKGGAMARAMGARK